MRTFVAILLTALLIASSAVKAGNAKQSLAGALRDAKSITLFSLEPEVSIPRDETGRCAGLCYFGWSVLGETSLKGNALETVRHELAAWVSAPEPDAIAMCFNPRHGVRVVTSKHTYDFVVCFECAQAEVYIDSASKPASNLFKGSDQSRWDALLKSAGVRLASPPDSGI